MPIASLQTSPLAPGVSPVEIHYREAGEGEPVVLLHGGWGWTLNPFNRQLEKLSDEFRVVCPDRSGYGGSTKSVAGFAFDFHYRAATETLSFLDALGIERAFFWGHSDGAVIAAIIGFMAPDRVSGIILEAFHYYRMKPSSREFFETVANAPETLGAELCGKFALEFGVDHWRRLITSHAKTWREIALTSSKSSDDLYGGRLHEVTAPTLLIHGRLDPRTEPDELDAVAVALPYAELQMLEAGGHGPHNEPGTADEATRLAREFLRRHSGDLLGPRASRPQ